MSVFYVILIKIEFSEKPQEKQLRIIALNAQFSNLSLELFRGQILANFAIKTEQDAPLQQRFFPPSNC